MSEDPAILAFEALRKEVSLLASGLEKLPTKFHRSAPDYAPTFAEIMQRIDKLNESCLVLAPEAWISALSGSIIDLTKRTIANELTPLAMEHRRYVEDMRDLTGAVRGSRATQALLASVFLAGAALGMILWIVFSGPLARSLPKSWRVPERMAEGVLDLDMWEAGEHLMATSDAKAWRRLRASDELIWTNRVRLATCIRGGKADHPAKCLIDVPSSTALSKNLGLPSRVVPKVPPGKRS